MLRPPRSLERLLRPRTIAVIGGGPAAEVVRQCDRMGYTGEIWPVHPGKDEVAGRRAYRSVADLPGAPDAAFVAVNRHLTIDVVRELAARGAGGAVCYASGFREAGSEDAEGESLQAALVEAAGAMPMIGPNCYGMINYGDGALLWPDQHGGQRLAKDARGVAIVTQSSNIAINMTMQRRGLPLAYVMTAGNQAQTGLSELALGLLDDPRVTALGLHIEGFDSLTALETVAAKARALKKPVVAMKLGRSAQARAATLSHTASLAGSDAASDAFLRRLGIARLNSIPAFLETLKLLHVTGPLAGYALSSMSCSGGEASVMADSAEGRRVFYRALTPAQTSAAKATLGPLVTVANPLDYHTFIWADEPAMTATFTAMVGAGFDLNLLVLDFPRGDRCADTDWWTTLRAFEAALKAHSAKGAVVASLPENISETQAADILARGLVPLGGIGEALDAAEAAADIGTAWRREAPPPVALATTTGGTTKTLDEVAAKDLLARHGVAVPAGHRVANAEEAIAAAEGLGYPVALKALGLAHKTEAGGVHLNLAGPEALRKAATALAGIGSGLYVERMVADPLSELIVGITADPPFGLVLTLGSGGVLVELLRDTVTLPLPATRAELEAALANLKSAPLLAGFRGRAKGDLVAVIETIEAVQRLVLAEQDAIVELEINPLIVSAEGRGAFAADALIVRKETSDA
ncbi:acetate--CoA ligase family protein [Pelagibius sp. 7325]|uniref:acetate--CoA ligase family protein n=1 Tax=Pelagibius sp. 7325 TaxID=3131994 RepID=UPI0030EDF86F